MPPPIDALSDLLLTLYAAPMKPELWPTFLHDFSAMLGLPAAAILHQDLAREKYSFAISCGMDPVAEDLYGQYFGKIDPWRPRFLGKQEGELAFGDELCKPSSLQSTEFYNDYLSKYDINLCTAIATIKRLHSFELISVYRGLRADMPSAETIAAIQLIVPHIRTALQLRRQLCDVDVRTNNFAEALESLSVGVILLDVRGQCIFVSRRAEILCTYGQGISIDQNRLIADDDESNQALCRAIALAVAVARGNTSRPSGIVSIRRPAGAALVASVVTLSSKAPLVELAASTMAIAAVFIRDPDAGRASLPVILAATYGLTPAETRLSCLLFSGSSPPDAAERLGVSKETIRVHLKSIFKKMRVRRQVELIRVIGELASAS